MDDIRKVFEKTIQENPYDLDTRKIFADWLEDNGDRPNDDDLAVHHREWTKEKQEAKEWMIGWTEQVNDWIRENYFYDWVREETGTPPDAAWPDFASGEYYRVELNGKPLTQPLTYESVMEMADHLYSRKMEADDQDPYDYWYDDGLHFNGFSDPEFIYTSREAFWNSYFTLRDIGEDGKIPPDDFASCSC